LALKKKKRAARGGSLRNKEKADQRFWEFVQRKENDKRQYQKDEDRYNSLCGPVTVTKIEPTALRREPVVEKPIKKWVRVGRDENTGLWYYENSNGIRSQAIFPNRKKAWAKGNEYIMYVPYKKRKWAKPTHKTYVEPDYPDWMFQAEWQDSKP